MTASKIIIAIDGFSSCGKSTLARQLAARLGYNYIDSGAMYRAVTLYFLRYQVDYKETEQVEEALENVRLSFEYNEAAGKSEIYLNGENVERYIRDLIVAEKVSEVAALKEVRDFAVAQQRKMGLHKGIVMDGRDIGTVVFPDAALKIFMTAEPEIRVKRRFEELVNTGQEVSLDEVKHNLELRDYIDSNRKESPLRKAENARILDNTNLSREEQLELVLSWVKEEVSQQQISLSNTAS